MRTTAPRGLHGEDDVSKQAPASVTGTGVEDHHSCTIEYLTGVRPTPTETESLVHEFTDLVFDYAISSPIDHSYQPTIEFCKKVIDSGGKLSIHSGTEPEIVSTLLDHKDISDLFDVIGTSLNQQARWWLHANKSNACSPG